MTETKQAQLCSEDDGCDAPEGHERELLEHLKDGLDA